MTMKKITYKGIELVLRFSWGAQYIYEASRGSAGAGFDARKTFDVHCMLWAALKAANREVFEDDFDAFVAELDAHPAQAQAWSVELLGAMADWGRDLAAATPEADGGKKKEEG